MEKQIELFAKDLVPKNAPYKAIQIASEFIRRGIRDGVDDMSMGKIQKMIYFAQGYFLAVHERPLIQEDFVAGRNGPIVLGLEKQVIQLLQTLIIKTKNKNTENQQIYQLNPYLFSRFILIR